MSTESVAQKLEQAKFYRQMNQRMKNTLRKAMRGDLSSCCEMGDYYAEENTKHTDYMEALKWYKMSANSGSDRAIFELGRLYASNAADITNAREESLALFMNLAEKGFPTAQCILGMKYWLGDGVENNPGEAVKWLELAAGQKHEEAIRHLGDLYASMHDDDKANKWYRIGAASGDTYCQDQL